MDDGPMALLAPTAVLDLLKLLAVARPYLRGEELECALALVRMLSEAYAVAIRERFAALMRTDPDAAEALLEDFEAWMEGIS